MNPMRDFSAPVAEAIAPEARERVLTELAAIEAEHEVKILFAAESGSRAWDFASPDSDYDVRFVYVHRLSWYLSVESGRDVIERPIVGDLDVSGWELRKALGLLCRSNPALLEWLASPLLYRSDEAALARLRALAAACFSPIRCRHHYLAMARTTFRGYLQGETVRLKKYLYVLRPLLAVRWIDRGYGMPPMRFSELVAATVEDEGLQEEIRRLLAIKTAAGEAENTPPWPALQSFILAELAREAPPELPKPAGQREAMDAFLQEAVMEFTKEENDV